MTSRYGDVPDQLVRAAADAVSAEIARMLVQARHPSADRATAQRGAS
jgi:hypothetical protein